MAHDGSCGRAQQLLEGARERWRPTSEWREPAEKVCQEPGVEMRTNADKQRGEKRAFHTRNRMGCVSALL